MLIISPASNWIIALGYAIGGIRGITIGVLLFCFNIFHPSLLAHPIDNYHISLLHAFLIFRAYKWSIRK